MIDMSIPNWILLGLIARFLGSKIVNSHDEGIVLGIFGAVAGVYPFSFFGGGRFASFNLYSVLVVTTGAILLLVVYPRIHRITVQRSFAGRDRC